MGQHTEMEKQDQTSRAIQELFDDIGRLAKLAAPIDPGDYEKKVFSYSKYPLGLDLICIPKGQAKSRLDAFVILEMIDLFYGNDWITKEEDRIDEENFVMEKPEMKEWEKLLSEVHFNRHFYQMKERPFHIHCGDIPKCISSFFWWSPETIPENERKEMKQLLSSATTIYRYYCEKSIDEYFFGETPEHYFLAYSGVYD